jgi:secretion/DNA translocation related TadE-like protein
VTRGPAIRGPARSGQEGAASVLVVALIGLAMLIGLAGAFVIATVAAHRRVQAAADLAALAGATAAQPGGGGGVAMAATDPCDVASRIATGNGAQLVECRVVGSDVLVTTTIDGPRYLGHGWDLTGQARAGPGSSG